MVNAQEWLDKEYPKEQRKEVERLIVNNQNLEGSLKLENFTNLETFYCNRNKLTEIDLSECYSLLKLDCSFNQLTTTDFLLCVPQPQKIQRLIISENNISYTTLDIFKSFENLERLWIGTADDERAREGICNSFAGSLEPLKDLKKLNQLGISHTDIDSGLEWLPKDLEKIWCYPNNGRFDTKVSKLVEKLKNFQAIGGRYVWYDYQAWRRSNHNLIAWVHHEETKWSMEENQKDASTNITSQDPLNSKLSDEVISKIKYFKYSYDFYNNLTREEKILINELIPDKELKERYKKYGLCQECQQSNTGIDWCLSCNKQRFQSAFSKWVSDNKNVNKFIQKFQIEATNRFRVLEWIHYEQFEDIKYLDQGGFSEVYKARWKDGPISYWKSNENKWERDYNSMVVLKVLKNSQNITDEFLREVTCHKLVDNGGFIVRFYGISQDPKTKNYIMVMEYMKNGNLRHYLSDLLNFGKKLKQLSNAAYGLKFVHQQGLIHRDFHVGNILNSDSGSYITDLGLCRPASETDQGKVYGVLAYVAPEVLRGEPYTQASDVYSFGIVAYEVFSGLFPYCDLSSHDNDLAVLICEGLRPDLSDVMIPRLLKNLISCCWNNDYLVRPVASEVYKNLNDWYNEFIHKKDIEFYRQYQEVESKYEQFFKNIPHRAYPKTTTASQLINTKQIARLFQESEEQALAEELKKMEREINQPLTKELKEVVSDFIQVHKKRLKNKKDKEARTKIKELKEKLEKNNLSEENIEKIIKYCERFFKEEKELEQLLVNIEIPTNK